MIERRYLIYLTILLSAAFLMGAIAYPFLPHPAPIHWNWRGQIDGYGPPWIDAFLLPLVVAFILILVLALSEVFYKTPLPPGFCRVLGKVLVSFMVLVLIIQGMLLLQVLGRPISVGRVMPVALGLFFAVIGNWFGKIRRNPYMGIRTPWTLANDVVWERTHRIGGRLFVADGIATAIAGLFAPVWASLGVLVVGVVALLIWSMIYSRQLYKRIEATTPQK